MAAFEFLVVPNPAKQLQVLLQSRNVALLHHNCTATGIHLEKRSGLARALAGVGWVASGVLAVLGWCGWQPHFVLSTFLQSLVPCNPFKSSLDTV